MSYSVHFRVKLATVPEPARDEIRQTMEQIGEALETVSAASPFWTSAKDSVLQIDVSGWRVVYRIDSIRHDLLVVELNPVRG